MRHKKSICESKEKQWDFSLVMRHIENVCERAKKKKKKNIQEESSLAIRHKKRVCKVLQFERQGSMVAICEYSLESLFHHPHAT